MHPPNGLESGCRTIRKRMYSKGTHPRKVPIVGQKNGDFFKGFTVEYIDKNKNVKADELAKAAAHNTPLPADVFLQIISNASIKTVESEPRVINIIQGEDW
jgi:hypothetical protein